MLSPSQSDADAVVIYELKTRTPCDPLVMSTHASSEGTTLVMVYSVLCAGRSKKVYVPCTSVSTNGDPGFGVISISSGNGESVVITRLACSLSQISSFPERDT